MTNHAAITPSPKSPLAVITRPVPTPPTPHQILIRNRAIVTNPSDGKVQDPDVYFKSYPAILGSDMAGTVERIRCLRDPIPDTRPRVRVCDFHAAGWCGRGRVSGIRPRGCGMLRQGSRKCGVSNGGVGYLRRSRRRVWPSFRTWGLPRSGLLAQERCRSLRRWDLMSLPWLGLGIMRT